MILTPPSSCSSFRNTNFTTASDSGEKDKESQEESPKFLRCGVSESEFERPTLEEKGGTDATPVFQLRKPNGSGFTGLGACPHDSVKEEDQGTFSTRPECSRKPTLVGQTSNGTAAADGKRRGDTMTDGGSGTERIAPSAPLKPSLKSGLSDNGDSASIRRVRWRWNECSTDSFAKLCDPTLRRVLSFLSMRDIVSLSGVSNRWRYLALQPQSWQFVDATDFVQTTNLHLGSTKSAARKTGDILASHLRPYSPEKLAIRSIRHRLQPESYLPSIIGLRELTLTEFNTLSDTHVHVMLLSSSVLVAQARSKSNNSLRKLVLEDCPMLTNASVRSIGSLCRQLEVLSLCGCPSVSSVMPLRDMFRIDELESHFAEPHGATSLHSFFAPPKSTSRFAPHHQLPASSSGLASLFAPLPSKPVTPVNQSKEKTPGLASLLASPGESTGSSSLGEAGRKKCGGGKLSRLNLSRTGVTGIALVDALQATRGNVVLESLEMLGSGESWADSSLEKLGSCRFKVFDIGCSNPITGSVGVTDTGIRALPQGELERLCLSGQKGIRTSFLARTLSAAPRLHSLNLAGCQTLFMGDTRSIAEMAMALQKTSFLEYVNLSRCFPDEKTAGSSKKVLRAHEELGKLILDALCSSASRFTLRELDLSWCWFVTASEVAQVRKSCPKLDRMHLLGTRCYQVGS